jgi:mannitol-specific phosphotransferase system IIBC component
MKREIVIISVATCTALFSFISGTLILRGVDKDDIKDKEGDVENKTKDSTNESEENSKTKIEVSAPKRSSNKKKGKRK